MKKDKDYYISKGLEEEMAEYFANGRKTIVDVIPQDNFTLIITFNDGEKRILDAKLFLEKDTVFEPFLDINNFNRVYVDDCHCIAWDIDPNVDSNEVWNNKVDLSSDYCYLKSKAIN